MKKILFLILINLTALCCGSEKIVSLSPALTELIFYLGSGSRLIGRSDVCNYPSEAALLPVAGKFADPHVERILSLKPTLIVTNDLINPNIKTTFEKCNIKTSMLQCRNIAEYRKCVEILSRILNAGEKGRKEIERIDNFLKKGYNVVK